MNTIMEQGDGYEETQNEKLNIIEDNGVSFPNIEASTKIIDSNEKTADLMSTFGINISANKKNLVKILNNLVENRLSIPNGEYIPEKIDTSGNTEDLINRFFDRTKEKVFHILDFEIIRNGDDKIAKIMVENIQGEARGGAAMYELLINNKSGEIKYLSCPIQIKGFGEK